MKICLHANALSYRKGGGHLWVYLNWALGFRALGCDVIWLESLNPRTSAENNHAKISNLKSSLNRYGFADSLALYSRSGEEFPSGDDFGCLSISDACDADLFLNQDYGLSEQFVRLFRRSALLDIDPGLLQNWVSRGDLHIARHDTNFSIGETVGRPASRIPSCGLQWQYVPPCVDLYSWNVHPASHSAPFTTVSHWYMEEWEFDETGELYPNDKRTGFQPYLELPRYTSTPLELAVCLSGDVHERQSLLSFGWRVRESWDVTETPWDYQLYIQQSRGEFSCAKPSCVRLQNAWISDRTLCYLASGKPAIVQHTGLSRFLPDANGLFRFRDMDEAIRCLEMATSDYERHCREARALAEEYFDAQKVAARVLELAL